MQTQELLEKILTQFPTYQEQKETIDGKLNLLAPDIKNSLEEYFNTTTISNIQVEGYTLQKLMEKHGMNIVAAHLTLDWLRKEPIKAMASLKKGHDLINNIITMQNELEKIEDFQNRLENLLAGELKLWAKRFNKEKMVAFDFGCFPWNGELSLNFCTEEEQSIINDPASWRLFMFNTHYALVDWTGKDNLQKWMQTMYDSKKYTADDFFKACANAVKSEKVQESLKSFNLSEDFKMTLLDPDNTDKNWLA